MHVCMYVCMFTCHIHILDIRENGNGVGRNGVGRFRRTGCTGMSVHAHGYVGARARHCMFLVVHVHQHTRARAPTYKCSPCA